jgi:hypothetical protein
MSFLDSLFDCVDKNLPRWKEGCSYRPSPVDIPGDYFVARRISIRGCTERGRGGINANFVEHALAYRDLSFSRKKRSKKQPLCAFSPKRNASDWCSSNDTVTCPDCAKIISDYSLTQAVLAKAGAWYLPG